MSVIIKKLKTNDEIRGKGDPHGVEKTLDKN